MKKTLTTLLLLLCVIGMYAAHNVYYVSPTGSDSNPGTLAKPFKTFKKGYDAAKQPGDTVYFRGGTYAIEPSEVQTHYSGSGARYLNYSRVFNLKNSGSEEGGHIVYAGYPGERPIFDFTAVTTTTRLQAFYIDGSYLHLKNFDIIGVQAPVTAAGENSQSECIAARKGSNCIFENLAMHDGMGIGYYQTAGSNNLVLNCDAYNIYDTNGMQGSGENSDGFGFHLTDKSYTGNKIKGCRAWWCVDDGFDCINDMTSIEFDGCWAFYNGFKPGTAKGVGNGNGFKAGGYGMSVPCSGFPGSLEAPQAPQNYIHHCVSYYNGAFGFYANHHLGGSKWENNTAMFNKSNFDMTNRDSTILATEKAAGATRGTDVDGYDHILINNVSYYPAKSTGDVPNNWTSINYDACTFRDNVIASSADFVDVTQPSAMADIELCKPRQADGSLPVISFLAAKATSSIFANQQGALFEDNGGYIAASTFLKWNEPSTWAEVHKDGSFEIGYAAVQAYDKVFTLTKTLRYKDEKEQIDFSHINKELCGKPRSDTSRTITFKVFGACTFDVFASKSSDDASTSASLNIKSGAYSGSGDVLNSKALTYGTISKVSYEYTGTGPSDIFTIYSDSTPIDLYGIRVTFTGTAIKGVIETQKLRNSETQNLKTFVNGKLVIRKADGSLYNIAGAKM